MTRQVLDAAYAKGVDRIDDLLLVGGMSRFHVAQRLNQEFPELPEARLSDPDQIVAKGAALFAAHQVAELDDDMGLGDRPKLPAPAIINVTSKGYGARVVRGEHDEIGYIAWLIRPNDEIPASPRDTFKTVSHNQTRVHFEVYESTTDVLSEDLTEHLKLIEGELVGLPNGRPAGQPIDVSYNLGDDGILRVTASASGQQLRLEAKIAGSTPTPLDPDELPNIMR
jgi:molecular chaperone DnaK